MNVVQISKYVSTSEDDDWDEYEAAYYALKRAGFHIEGKLIVQPSGWEWVEGNLPLLEKAYLLINERDFEVAAPLPTPPNQD
jgi:hypothetical protein